MSLMYENSISKSSGAKSTWAISVALIAASLIFAWRALAGTFQLGFQDIGYTHILLILPISGVFLYKEWSAVRSLVRRDRPWGVAFLVLGASIMIVSHLPFAAMTSDLRLSLGMLGLVTWWIGSFVFCFGTRVVRSLLFPVALLYCMVPLPEFALNAIIKFLQQGSAFAAWSLFVLAGVPVAQDDLLLSIPGLTVEVAKECSSIRSSMMLLVTTLVLAQLFLRSPLRKALVVAIAVPLSIAKNGLRIFTIAMLGTRVDASFLTGRFHHQGGIIFFAISLAMILLLLWILERGERRTITQSGLTALVSC